MPQIDRATATVTGPADTLLGAHFEELESLMRQLGLTFTGKTVQDGRATLTFAGQFEPFSEGQFAALDVLAKRHRTKNGIRPSRPRDIAITLTYQGPPEH